MTIPFMVGTFTIGPANFFAILDLEVRLLPRAGRLLRRADVPTPPAHATDGRSRLGHTGDAEAPVCPVCPERA